MKPENYTFTALAAFACYNEYGTTDGLIDEEVVQWGAFVAGIPDEGERAPSFINCDSVAGFGCCEVTNLRGDVVQFTAVWLGAQA